MTQPDLQAPIALHNILFGTDFSPASEVAFSYAKEIADRYQAQLYVAHVISLDVFDLIAHDSISGVLKQARDKAQEKIAQLAKDRNVIDAM